MTEQIYAEERRDFPVSDSDFGSDMTYTDGRSSGSLLDRVNSVLCDAVVHLGDHANTDGSFVFNLEADATISSEYIFLNHYLGIDEREIEHDLARYIRSLQSDVHGGWPLFYGGGFNISASVKAYYALKLVGDDVESEHMVRARSAILAHGGAETSNVFTRYALALFGQVPWHAVPVMPIELMLMPRRFPITIWKLSYWSRTVVVPLMILAALKPVARNPRGLGCGELFCCAPSAVKNWHINPRGDIWGALFLRLNAFLTRAEPFFPRRMRDRAISSARDFITERLNGEDGLGAIFPAMANSVMAFDALGYGRDHPDFVVALESVRALVTDLRIEGQGGESHRFCQPCVSPVWDTALAGYALAEAGCESSVSRAGGACDWLEGRQVRDVVGDWSIKAPHLRPGGWAFQYNNAHYPDIDDTAVVGMLLHRQDSGRYDESISRAVEWIIGMQSSNGGWGAFDIDNNMDVLNSIPFADHGALLDPPTSDVTARCLSFLAQAGYGLERDEIRHGLAFLRSEQEDDGSWFGRWGTNYIYGTWSVLSALNAVGEDMGSAYVRRGVDWLLGCQNADGGWGEDGSSYEEKGFRKLDFSASTPSQTSWAVLGLMAAGEVDHEAVERGILWLTEHPREGSAWREPWFTAVGFPRVFYLRYDGYRSYFPTFALARYRNLKRGNSNRVIWGM